MSESLFSESWYRVKAICPALRHHAQIHRHFYRGGFWYVLQDHSSGKYHRFSPEAYQIIGLMDGIRTLDQIWAIACERLGDDMPTQDEVITLLGQLHRADALKADIPPDIQELVERHQREKSQRFWGQIKSPLSLKFHLFDPERFLSRTFPAVRPLFGWVGLIVWLLVISWALSFVGPNWDALTRDVADRIFAAENLLLIWFIYPLVKIAHEFAHAYAVKKGGGEVHEMGIMLLVLMPIPFVDASASLAFRDKRQRILVGAAGILVELFLAALALIAWVHMEPGAMRAVAYNVLLICGVSTVLFNGNPLLRFDAYYVLSDYLEIPNMAGRGSRYLGYLVQRYILKIPDRISPAHTPGEAAWIAVYAFAAFIYRIFISVRIILFVAGKFFFIGILLAIWAMFNMIAMPLMKMFKTWLLEPSTHLYRARVLAFVGTILVGAFLLLVVLPLPSFTVVEGVVWAPVQAHVYAGTSGFFSHMQATPGRPVEKGALLMECENPNLIARVASLSAQMDEFRFKLRSSLVRDRNENAMLKDELERVEGELARARERQQALKVVSPTQGVFVVQNPEDLHGQFVARGDTLGYVIDPEQVMVRAVVPQERIDLVRHRTRSVQARLSGDVETVGLATVLREVPSASQDLPSLALSLQGGGKIALSPQETERPQAFNSYFQFELKLNDRQLNRLGERVYIRFTHEPEPLIKRWYRDTRRMFLSYFAV
jgi:putative peptide zinc metalloprotease protein